MSLKNLNGIVDRIISKRIPFIYNTKWYYYQFPDSELKFKSIIVYEEAYEQLKFDTILEEEIDYHLEEYDIADRSLKKFLEKQNKKLEDIKVELFQNFYQEKKKKDLKKKIAYMNGEILKTMEQLHYLDRLTIENICSNIQNEFLLANGIFDRDDKLVFNYNNINSIDQTLFGNMNSIIATKFLSSSEYKEVARSYAWRSMWNIKNHTIFVDPVCEWSEEQKTLVNISQMYDNVYQHPDCPDDEIIEDDDALDGWSIYHNRKNKLERKQKGVNDLLDGKHKDANEVFMVAETQQDLENIFSLNDANALGRIKSKMDFLSSKKGGQVREIELPDVQADLAQQSSNLRK